jgi:hypothetical protein
MKKLLLASVLAIASFPGYPQAKPITQCTPKECAKIAELPLDEYCSGLFKTKEQYDRCMANKEPWPSPNFVGDCRRDRLIVHVDEKAKGDWPPGWELPGVQVVPPTDGERRFVIINDVDKAARSRLEKELREWRKCDIYYQCLADRDAGKVKHCYANDKRWRGIGVDGL